MPLVVMCFLKIGAVNAILPTFSTFFNHVRGKKLGTHFHTNVLNYYEHHENWHLSYGKK